MSLPLEGIRVIDFSRVLAGPHCAKTLLDLGADVVKIEPPSGDISRKAFPNKGEISGYYAQQNAGKRNLSIDLNIAGARDVVAKLCDEADVIVENFRPGALAAFGLDYATVSVTVGVAGGGTATVNFGEARAVDLKLTQGASHTTVGVGGVLTLTYRLKNLGTLDATGVMVTAQLPAGFKYLGSEATGSAAKYDPASQRITVGTLAPGAEVVVKVQVRSNVAGAVRLRATAQALEAEDNVQNNTAALVVTTAPPAAATPSAATLAWLLWSAHR